MSIFASEALGTFFLILFGTGVVANVLLNKSKGHNSGWLVITLGWAMAVFVGVFVAAKHSGAHINPAVTLAFAMLEKVDWADVPQYMGGQLIGAMLGSAVAWMVYYKHFLITEDATLKLAVFSTAPAIRNAFHNLLAEIIGTFALVMGVLFIIAPSASLGALDALPVALLVLAIGLGLGGPTGYAINPARDLGPRIMHAVLPIGNKGSSDWGYAWIPILGPFIGAALAALLYAGFLR